MKTFNKSVSAFVAFTLFFTQFELTAQAAQKNSTNANFISYDDIESLAKSSIVKKSQDQAAASLKEFEAADDQSVPKNTKDVFSLVNQKLIIHSPRVKTNSGLTAVGKVFPLNSDLAPLVVVTNFNTQVKILTDRKTKTITLDMWRHGEHLASHIIEGFDVVASARDKEFFTFLDARGKVYSFDTALAANISFRAPIPVFEIAEMDRNLITDNLKATYRTRGGMPNYQIDERAIVPLDLVETSIYRAGSFDVYDTATKKYVGIYTRNGLRTYVYRGEAILDLLAYMVNPGEESKNKFESIRHEANDTQIKTMTSAYLENMDPSLRGLIRTLPRAALDSLTKRYKQNKSLQNEPLDQFTSDEANKAREIILRAYQEESKLTNIDAVDFRENYRKSLDQEYNKEVHKSLIQKLKEPHNLKIIASIVAGVVTVSTAYALWNGVGPTWAVNFVHNIYDVYIPTSFKSSSFRVNALLSSASMLSFMPLIFVIGAAYSKIKTLNMDAIKATAKLGMVIWGTIMLPVFHYAAKLAMQPNFIRAMQYGINPLQKIQTDRGPVRPGINVLKNSPRYKEDTERNAHILRLLYDKRSKIKALSHALALLAVAQEYGVDPTTLFMVEQKAYTPETLELAATDKNFRRLWNQSAKELESYIFSLSTTYSPISKLSEMSTDKDISELDQVEFTKYSLVASSIAKDVISRPKLKLLMSELKPQWNMMSRKLFTSASHFAVEESNYLKNADPSEFSKKLFFLQFTVDYSISVPQITFTGTRSDITDVPSLAAKPDQETLNNYLENPPKSTGNEQADKENLAQWEKWQNPTFREEVLSRYMLWSNPQHMASMLDQVRIYGINVPAMTSLVYDKFSPIVEANYGPLEEVIYKEKLPRREKLLESIWQFSKDILNVKKAQYGYLWVTKIIKRIKSLQATLLFTVIIERIMMAGQPVDAALLSFIFIFLTAHIKYGGVIWDPVERGMHMRDERLEVAAAKLLDAKVTLSQAIRLGQQTEDRALAEAFKNITGFYKESKTELPEAIDKLIPEVNKFLISNEFAMLPEFKESLKQQGLELLNYSKTKAPFATKENGIFNWGTMISASLLTTFFLIMLETETYKTLSYFEKIGNGLILFGSVYSSAYLFQKLITKWESRKFEKAEFAKAERALSLKLNNGDKEAAAAYMQMSDLYKLAEKRLPQELREFEQDVMIFIFDKNKNKMDENFSLEFKDKSEKLLQYARQNPSYEKGGLINKTVDAGQRITTGFNQACKMYVQALGGILTAK